MAKTLAAIIDGVLVPPAEVKALRALVHLRRPATVPEIARSMNDELSDASLYTLLGRLAGQRGLVTREEATVDVQGTALRRVLWRPHPASVRHFSDPEETTDDTTFAEGPRARARAPG
ncbi:hypothetical protein HLB44_04905 [Aquincola sp. S2]|uniref:HTH iclR-type domain-containing protein n=1 Tax=Pseudaquabacterium terrae TaxID=2732868 RepID=A0ABX2EDK4_9BURK|nr:hypothetical protein [Aquabacterium terrae]NRF66317.1 hypothetical protein [Aquabacterium terrae]